MQFVILGNGIAGVSAAYTMRRLDQVAPITIISKEPHSAYSACLLPDYLSGEISRERVFVKKFPDYAQQNIRLILGKTVIALDTARKTVNLSSGAIPYDKLIIATGSTAFIPPIKGREKKGVFIFKSLEDADLLSRWKGQRAVVIGSGPIGVEAGLALQKRGYRVFLVEFLDSVLPQVFDRDAASFIQALLQHKGMKVLTGERVTEILGGESVQGVATKNRKLTCDTVVLATGMRPEVSLVEGTVQLGKLGGILTDDTMCTSVPDIYACGDCVEAKSIISGLTVLSLLWHNAREQGEIAACNAVGMHRNYLGSINITGMNAFGLHVVSIGNIGKDIENGGLEVIERKGEERYQRLILSKGVLVGAQSINWTENIGGLLAAIRRKERIRSWRDLTSGRAPLLSSVCCFPFGRRLS